MDQGLPVDLAQQIEACRAPGGGLSLHGGLPLESPGSLGELGGARKCLLSLWKLPQSYAALRQQVAGPSAGALLLCDRTVSGCSHICIWEPLAGVQYCRRPFELLPPLDYALTCGGSSMFCTRWDSSWHVGVYEQHASQT